MAAMATSSDLNSLCAFCFLLPFTLFSLNPPPNRKYLLHEENKRPPSAPFFLSSLLLPFLSSKICCHSCRPLFLHCPHLPANLLQRSFSNSFYWQLAFPWKHLETMATMRSEPNAFETAALVSSLHHFPPSSLMLSWLSLFFSFVDGCCCQGRDNNSCAPHFFETVCVQCVTHTLCQRVCSTQHFLQSMHKVL